MRNYIGLESNDVRIDVHESKIPLIMIPKFVAIYHNNKLLYYDTINFDNKTGEAIINLRFRKDKFDRIFNSTGRYLPFVFKFMTESKATRILRDKGIKTTTANTSVSGKNPILKCYLVIFRNSQIATPVNHL